MESFNGKLRDERLNRERFLRLAEARYLLDECRLEDNHRRPHGALDWRTLAEFAAAVKAREDRADGTFLPAQSPSILSQGLDQILGSMSPARPALGRVREIRWCSISAWTGPKCVVILLAIGSGTAFEPSRLRERGQVDASGGLRD